MRQPCPTKLQKEHEHDSSTYLRENEYRRTHKTTTQTNQPPQSMTTNTNNKQPQTTSRQQTTKVAAAKIRVTSNNAVTCKQVKSVQVIK